MANTISQRISLEGSEDIRKKLEDLGKAGEKSFKQISDAASNVKVDPARVDQTKQAFDRLGAAGAQLGDQFKGLAESVVSFGSRGVKSALDVASGLQQTAAAAEQVGSAIGQASQQIAVSGQSASQRLISTATAFKIAAAGIVGAIAAITNALTKGAVETGSTIADQAEKLKIPTEQWVELRKAIAGSGVSNEDFVKSADTANKQLDKMRDELKGVFQEFDFGGNKVTVVSGSLSKATGDLAKLFRDLGLNINSLRTGDNAAVLRELATAISRMPDATKQAAAGVKLFGENWKEVIKVLATAPGAITDPLKASRELTAEQVDTAKKVKEAWDDLGKAVRATRDQIGALFLGGALGRAEWLTNLVDGTRELLKNWLGLSEVEKGGFLENLASGPAETAFKVLVALGNQLAGIWRDVLVPAGEMIAGIIGQIADNLEGVKSTDIAAFFITAAIAATGLAIALKGIQVVLTPFSLLISLFSGFGPILIPLIALVALFWDQIKEGATKAMDLIPNAILGFKQAFAALFAGDFQSFWGLFAASADVAFRTIKQSILQSEGVLGDFMRAITGEGAVQTPWVKEFVDSIKEIAKELPAAIGVIIIAFLALRRAGVALAPIMSRIFGTEISGTGAILLTLIGSMTGALQALASVATVVASAFTAFGVSFGILATIVGGPWALVIVAALAAIAAALAALIIYWPEIKQAAIDASNAIEAKYRALKAFIDEWVTTPVANAWGWIKDTWNGLIAWVNQKVAEGKAFINEWVTTPVENAWGWINQKWDEIIGYIGTKVEQGKQLVRDWVTTPVANAWGWIKQKWNEMLASLGFGGGTPAPADGNISGNARGGLIGGRGTGTSDSNLSWVSRGEHIMPAHAVAQPGVLAFLESLRHSGGNLRAVLDGMGRFALGGMVRAPISIPAFAGGGMNHVTINFPGLPEITGLRASSGVVDELRRAAALSQVRSGGRKPSRYS
jgi:hypothetical protein